VPSGKYLYEMQGAKLYGYFSGKYLYTMAGKATHYLAGSDDKYLYSMGGKCEFYEKNGYFYEFPGSKLRWYRG